MTDILNLPSHETRRLIFRGPREEDFEAFAEFCASERSAFTGGPFDRAGARRLFLAGYGHWLVHGYGLWTTIDKASGAVIGRNGLSHLEGHDAPEMTIYFYEGHEGAGNGTEVLNFLRQRGRAMGHDWLFARIAPFNHRSLRLAEAVDAAHVGDEMTARGPLRVYRFPSLEVAA